MIVTEEVVLQPQLISIFGRWICEDAGTQD
jgi:hypothetical protein